MSEDEEIIKKNCEDIYQSLSDMDNNSLIQKVAKLSTTERKDILDNYKKINGKDLMDEFKRKLSNQLQDIMIGLFTDPFQYDAECINRNMNNQESIIEILCTRPKWIIEKVMKKFNETYHEDLEDKIRSETLGDLKNLLIGLLKANRVEADKEDCEEQAEDLANLDDDEWSVNTSSHFYRFLTNYKQKELILISALYKQKKKKTIYQQIDNVFLGEIKKFINAAVYCLISPSEYLATKVRTALKGVSVDYQFLIRLFITRRGIDLNYIRKYYHKLYGKNMADDIDTYIKDDYKEIFLEMMRNDDKKN